MAQGLLEATATSAGDLAEAIALAEAGRLDAAALVLRRRIASDPAEVGAVFLLGRVLTAKGAAAAIAWLRRCRRLVPDNPAVAADLALALATDGSGSPDAAIAAARTALIAMPDRPGLWHALGRGRARCGTAGPARAALDRAARLDPDGREIQAALATMCLELGEYGAALAAFDRAIILALAHIHPTRARRVARRDFAIDQDPERIRERLDPADAAGHLALGNALRARGDPDGAAAAYMAGLRLAPEDPSFRSRLGCVLADLGWFEEAGRCFASLPADYAGPERVLCLDPAFLARCRETGAEDAAGPESDTGDAAPGLVVVIGCDGVYARRFGPGLARSLAESGTRDCLLHLHLVDCGDDADIRAALAAAAPGLAVRTSLAGPVPPGVINTRTCYACARFLALPALLRHYRRPLLILDADMLVLGDLGRLAGSEAGDLALFRVEEPVIDPWDRLQASAVLVRPTPAGLAMAGFLKVYIQAMFDRGRSDWYLDQAALFALSSCQHIMTPPGHLTLLPRPLFALHARAGAEIEALRRQGVLLLSLVASAPDNAAAITGLVGA